MPDEKVLYLMRHAQSDWPSSNQNDFDRPLSQQGFEDAPRMGKRLKLRGVSPDLLISSPATRTVQTMELLLTELGLAKDAVLFNENMYDASVETLLEVVQSINDRFSNVMLIGHNPSITWIASLLSGESVTNLPPASVVTIRLACDRWKDAGIRAAELLDLDFPAKSETV